MLLQGNRGSRSVELRGRSLSLGPFQGFCQNHIGFRHGVFGSLSFLLFSLATPAASFAAPAGLRPNILVIMTDDQSHDTVSSQFMPITKAEIADEGLTAANFVMPTALCCPSRASFLTGKYQHNAGVYGNHDHLIGPTVVNALHDAGYFTGLSGKYLNSWPGTPRPEFDFWAGWITGYVNPMLNLQGEAREVPGYMTYLLRDQAVAFLDKVPPQKPFFLLFAPHAPHKPAIPAPGDEKLYSDLPRWRPHSFNPRKQADKPAWLANKKMLTNKQIELKVDEFRLDQLRCLHSTDIAVGDILKKLRQQGKLDNTFVVYYSDNGYFWGEHRLLFKNRVYEEASHGPFLVRYPPLIPQPRTERRLIGVIDLAPTFYDLAGIPPPSDIDGRSLLPLLTGTDNWRTGILLEGWRGQGKRAQAEKEEEQEEEREADSASLEQHRSNPPNDIPENYRAIRTEEFIYVETVADKPELYDLQRDPLQMHNLISNPFYARTVAELRKRLHEEKL